MTDAQKAEALDVKTPVEFNGHTYHVDPADLTWEALEADAAGNYSLVIKAWLGDDQWETFKTLNPHPLYREDGILKNTSMGMRAAIMVALGNSPASSGS